MAPLFYFQSSDFLIQQDEEDQEATISLSHTHLVTTSMHLLTKRLDSVEEMIPALVQVVR